MPIGPRGEKRPADANACAVMVAKIATGEIEDPAIEKSGRVRSGKLGGAARAQKLSPQRRKEVAEKAAHARWQTRGLNVEMEMTEATEKRCGRPPQEDDVALMYPSNQLGKQVRDFKDTLRMATVIRREFFDKK